MRHYCTYFDSTYLTRGLALYNSLIQHSEDEFLLWVLCFDDLTYNVLNQLDLPQTRLISIEEFEGEDSELSCAKENRTIVEYYWTCTPSLPLYILNHNTGIDVITYLDADLYFFSDPSPVFDEFGNGSIAIIGHRFPPALKHLETNGIFNVGLMIFRRDDNGLTALTWWRDRCLEWCYARAEDGKFGDQKYLDDWPQRFQSVVVLENKGVGLAPWNISAYRTRSSNLELLVDEDRLVFYHFHDYKIINDFVVQPASKNYPISPPQIKDVYLPYTRALDLARKQTTELGIEIPKVRDLTSIWHILKGVLNQYYILVKPECVSVCLWRLGRWSRTSEDRVCAGFNAYASGDLSSAWNYLIRSVLCNPFLLVDLRIVAVLIEPLIGSARVAKIRRWRRRMARSKG